MDTRLGYLGGVISIIIAFFPENNWAKFAFGSIGAISLVLAYIFKGKASSKQEITQHKKAAGKKQKKLKLSNDHVSILKVFRENDGELTSVPLIQQITGLETIIVNAILDDFVKYDIIHATNLDEFEGGWQYQLSDKGRKKILKST